MSEEEPTELEEVKFRGYLIILNSEFPTHRKTEAMEELLKIYNKQQQEIKELKDIKADYIRRTESSNKMLLKQGYISKDKIKEKIKHYKKQKEIVLKASTFKLKAAGISADGIEGLNDMIVYKTYEGIEKVLNGLLEEK